MQDQVLPLSQDFQDSSALEEIIFVSLANLHQNPNSTLPSGKSFTKRISKIQIPNPQGKNERTKL